MKYTISVDGKYFVGETMEFIDGHAIAPLGFFQMVGNNQATAYEFSNDRTKASELILFNALTYLTGIYERTRYLPDEEKPKKIVIEQQRMSPTVKTVDDMKNDLLLLAKDVYEQGFEDGRDSSPAFEDGLECDVTEQITQIFEEFGIDADRMGEIINAEHEGWLRIEAREGERNCDVCKGLVHGAFTTALYCFKCGRKFEGAET